MANVLGWIIIYAHGTSQKAGVAILFSNKNVEIVNKYVDSKGHCIILDMLVDKVRYTLVNMYAPNTDVTFFSRYPFEGTICW